MAIPDIVARMLPRLYQFDSMKADAGNELEVWSVGDPLQAMLKKQRERILQRVDKAKRAYAALADQSL